MSALQTCEITVRINKPLTIVTCTFPDTGSTIIHTVTMLNNAVDNQKRIDNAVSDLNKSASERGFESVVTYSYNL